jgi:hypothetical protein
VQLLRFKELLSKEIWTVTSTIIIASCFIRDEDSWLCGAYNHIEIEKVNTRTKRVSVRIFIGSGEQEVGESPREAETGAHWPA